MNVLDRLKNKPIPRKKRYFEIAGLSIILIKEPERSPLESENSTPQTTVKPILRVMSVIKLKTKLVLKADLVEKLQDSVPEPRLEDIQIDHKFLKARMEPPRSKIIIRSSSYFMNNREMFINFINSIFTPYKDEMLSKMKEVSCENRSGKDFSLLIHQKIVRDYINHYTPYRGLLLYHGLGSGKTCSSIGIAEGLKSDKQIIIMTPASLRMNYIEELKKCGDPLYKFNQFWEFIRIKNNSPLEKAISGVLSLSINFIRKQGGAWFVNAAKESNFAELSIPQKSSLDIQINKMIEAKYKFINYNGLRMSSLKVLTNNGKIKNPFDNKVIIIDEAHNFVSRIVNKMGSKDSLSLRLYEYLKSAENARIIFLTGTPIINYPNEIGIMFNILRGYIKTFIVDLEVKTHSKINTAFFQKVFRDFGLLDYVDYNSSKKKLLITRNPFGFVNNKTKKYSGISLNDRGDIKNSVLFQELKKVFKSYNVVIKKVSVENNLALPDKIDEFRSMFINEEGKMININLFQRRIVGLTSYYRSAHEELLPAYNTEKDFIVQKVNMSLYQLGIYEIARQSERDQIKRSTMAKKMKGDLYAETSSTYRIFSRLFCNFVFPNEHHRPLPTGEFMNEDILDNTTAKERLENNTDDAKIEKKDMSYDRRILAALRFLKKQSAQFLSKEALKTYSPKFLAILENIQKSEGLHLVYSQFRTLEGIAILKMVLEEAGYYEFKIQKKSGLWEIEDIDKLGSPSFVLYTGTESSIEKEMIRNIFNGEWEKIPKNIMEDLKRVSENNNHGEIIKTFMITSAGAEGISLHNVRFVHITEPYWHPVRVEQVIGRARRICSHQYLPKEEQNVKVFLYLMTFPKEFIEKDQITKELKLRDVSKLDKTTPLTTDEALYEISTMKLAINQQLLKAIKESSIDCLLYGKANAKEKLSCFSIGGASEDGFSYPPSIAETETDLVKDLNVRTRVWRAKKITIGDKAYAYKEDSKEIYDLESYKLGKPLLKGTLIVDKDGKLSGVTWI